MYLSYMHLSINILNISLSYLGTKCSVIRIISFNLKLINTNIMGCGCKNKANQTANPNVPIKQQSIVIQRPDRKPDQTGIWIEDNTKKVDVWFQIKNKVNAHVNTYDVLIFQKADEKALPVLVKTETRMFVKNKLPVLASE